MKFLIHTSNASRETPLRDIFARWGYHGIGVFWCIMEHVVLTEGECTLDELQRMFCTRKYGKEFIKSLVLDYGCFIVDEYGRVALNPTLPCAYTESKKGKNPFITKGACNGATKGVTCGASNGARNSASNGASKGASKGARNGATPTCVGDKDRDREEEKEGEEVKVSTSTPPSSSIVIEDPDAASVRKAAGERMICEIFDDLYKAKVLFQEWYEQICMKFGHGGMLQDNWTLAVDMFKSHIICRGKWNDYVQTGYLLKMAAYYLTDWGNTHQEVVDEIMAQRAEARKVEADTDFMATYTGPPLPDDAPPRPSFTAIYNFGDDVWQEPREVIGVKGSKI